MVAKSDHDQVQRLLEQRFMSPSRRGDTINRPSIDGLSDHIGTTLLFSDEFSRGSNNDIHSSCPHHMNFSDISGVEGLKRKSHQQLGIQLKMPRLAGSVDVSGHTHTHTHTNTRIITYTMNKHK
eukprot:GHVR01063464.1.p1 GENE.GHVR01063464.1~~GHVR01063464.1.p1  ORF type:complete len:124 (+),score=43.44 GHVR01063464.1:45-416(+)